MSVVIMGWRDVFTDDGGVRGNTDEEALANATFIAHARTMSPAACRCLLLAIEGLGKICIIGGGRREGNAHAAKILTSIRQEWHNLTTK